MKFELDAEQAIRYRQWCVDQNKTAIQKQRVGFKPGERIPAEFVVSWELGYPYTGAIGGSDTFSFTHTSLGTICKVKNAITGDELDLTDYHNW